MYMGAWSFLLATEENCIANLCKEAMRSLSHRDLGTARLHRFRLAENGWSISMKMKVKVDWPWCQYPEIAGPRNWSPEQIFIWTPVGPLMANG